MKTPLQDYGKYQRLNISTIVEKAKDPLSHNDIQNKTHCILHNEQKSLNNKQKHRVVMCYAKSSFDQLSFLMPTVWRERK